MEAHRPCGRQPQCLSERPVASKPPCIWDDDTGNPFCVHTDGSDLIVRWSWTNQEPDLEIGTVDDFVAGWLVQLHLCPTEVALPAIGGG
jgi:hypothetical protein